MNILFTTSQGDVAGSTNSIYYLATSLADRGHNVWMACRPESLIFQMLQGSRVIAIPMHFKGKFDLKAARKIKELVNTHQINIINSQSGRDRFAIIWSRVFYGNKCIHINSRRQKPQSDGGKLVSRFITNNTEKIVAVSYSIKSELIKIGYPAPHVHVIHNGTPRDKYNEPDKRMIDSLRNELQIDGSIPVLGSVSRLKNHIQLLKALSYLDEKVKLILVGIEKSEEFRKIVSGYTIPHEVHFIGTVSNEKALNYMALFDINILPSTMEGISQSILEAMALGIPVIATNASGNPELIRNGENGLLFEDGDIEGLANDIVTLRKSPGLKAKISKAGRITAFEEFSIERTVDKYEAFFGSF